MTRFEQIVDKLKGYDCIVYVLLGDYYSNTQYQIDKIFSFNQTNSCMYVMVIANIIDSD